VDCLPRRALVSPCVRTEQGSPSDEAPGLEIRHARSARICNYWLDGKDNFAADQEAASPGGASADGSKRPVRKATLPG